MRAIYNKKGKKSRGICSGRTLRMGKLKAEGDGRGGEDTGSDSAGERAETRPLEMRCGESREQMLTFRLQLCRFCERCRAQPVGRELRCIVEADILEGVSCMVGTNGLDLDLVVV